MRHLEERDETGPLPTSAAQSPDGEAPFDATASWEPVKLRLEVEGWYLDDDASEAAEAGRRLPTPGPLLAGLLRKPRFSTPAHTTERMETVATRSKSPLWGWCYQSSPSSSYDGSKVQ